MEQLYIDRLLERDRLETRFCELFLEFPVIGHGEDNIKQTSKDSTKSAVARLRRELGDKDVEIKYLKEVIEVKKKDTEKLNNELISLNIENNLMREKQLELEDEHDKLVKRWLERVHQEFDVLNAK